MNSTTKTILILAAVGAAGYGAWYLYQKNKKTTAPVTAVTNSNPNAAAGSGLAGNITAATGAFNSLSHAFGVGAA